METPLELAYEYTQALFVQARLYQEAAGVLLDETRKDSAQRILNYYSTYVCALTKRLFPSIEQNPVPGFIPVLMKNEQIHLAFMVDRLNDEYDMLLGEWVISKLDEDRDTVNTVATVNYGEAFKMLMELTEQREAFNRLEKLVAQL
jgi:hypothetical protein